MTLQSDPSAVRFWNTNGVHRHPFWRLGVALTEKRPVLPPAVKLDFCCSDSGPVETVRENAIGDRRAGREYLVERARRAGRVVASYRVDISARRIDVGGEIAACIDERRTNRPGVGDGIVNVDFVARIRSIASAAEHPDRPIQYGHGACFGG